MSNTVITSYVDVSGSISKTGKQLVVLVNKDGSLSLEKNVLDSLLNEENPEDVSVSLVHVNEDGKLKNAAGGYGSDDDDDDVPRINLTVNAFYDPATNEDPSKNDVICEISEEILNLFRLSFQNDHCYTPHTLPDVEEKPFAAQSGVGSSTQGTKSNIPSSKKITILENKIIPKGKKLINLSTLDGQIILKRSDLIRKIAEARRSNTTTIISSSKNSLITGTLDKGQPVRVEAVKSVTSISPKETVSDSKKSNLSFQNEYIKNLSKDLKPNIINKNVKNLLTKKIESKRVPNALNQDVDEQINLHKPLNVKSYSRDITNKSSHKKIKKTIELKGTEMMEVNKLMPDKVDVNKTNKASKKKPPPAHMTALLNDMTSLFSTPDVLRRVSTDAKSPKIPDQLIGNVGKKPETHMEVDENSLSKSEIRTYSNTSKLNPLPIYRKDTTNEREANISQMYQESGESLLHASISHLPPLLQNENLQTTSNILMHSSSNINGPLSPSLDILGGIQAEEEGLSEDLLMHVAQLVESSEKLQEVIDNQVLGKVDNMQPKDIMTSIHTPILQNMDIIRPEKPTTPVTRKEPIQIVRSNGRVITLPPIEAPATRASKRRSLLNAPTEQPAPALPVVKTPVVDETPLVVPSPISTQSKPATTVIKKTNKLDKNLSLIIPPREVEEEENIESDESWNSEDDPDRLWCICKQPHNNRFMICCDMCEDWFHGKCVNITKAMGQEMEEKGIEWRCPTCTRKKNLGKLSLKPSSPRKSVDSKSEANLESDAYSHLAVTPGKSPPVQGGTTSCIVCKKAARPSSIYCSDACILKHAQESLSVTLPHTSGTKHGVPPKDDARVIVYERKTGKYLAGPSAPTAANLKTWLKEHPTFEVVKPGTIPSNKQYANTSRTKLGASKVQSVLKIGEDKQIMLVQPSKNQASPVTKTPQALPKQAAIIKPSTPKVKEAPKSQSASEQSPKLQLNIPSSKQATKTYPKTPTTPKTPTQKQPSLKSPTTPASHRKDDIKPKIHGMDPIRENVKKTLQEQLSIRMGETKNVKFSPEEISKFAIDTEYELHDLFKDVGVKYKAKYRSLMFNLKDRKNLSLWQKICDRSITPKQLVRFSPEELASQELAQWRDQEAKHQLELIKKSELDLLACNKTYVLKTHKGEEVIENKSLPTAELGPNVTLDDIVSALNNSKEEESKDQNNDNTVTTPPSSPSRHRKHSHSSHHKHYRHRSRSRSKSSRSKRERSSDRHKTSSRHESSKGSKSSSSRSRHKKSSNDKNKSLDRHSDSSYRKSSHGDSLHGTSSHSGHHNSSSRSREKSDHEKDLSEMSKRSQSRDRSKSRRSRSRDNKRISKDGDKPSIDTKDKFSPKESEKTHHKRHESHSLSHEKLDIDEKLILKAAEDTDILLPPVENVDVASPPSPGAPQINSENVMSILGSETEQELSSTMDSVQSVIWNGSISMVDVAKFNIAMYEISGACNLVKDLKLELEIVGRIQPETVWDYVDKVKKQSNKEIVLTKISPANEDEQEQYGIFYNYLNSRNRLGVVKSHRGSIKDFYVVPLPSQTSLPSVLLPLDGPGLGEIKPNLLIGVIVGQRRKRPSANISAVPAKMFKSNEKEEGSYTPPVGSYTPPQSPKPALPTYPLPLLTALSSTVKHQIAASLACADDEPYSPGDSDSMSHSPTDLHKKMEELDRKIEERKKQIQSIAGNITSTNVLDEPYSPSRPMSPESSTKPNIPRLSDISLPSNLQEILATIQQNTASTPDPKPVKESTYIPTAINLDVTTAGASIYYKEGLTGDVDMRVIGTSYNKMSATNVYTGSDKTTSKLSSLSEAELLSMVPDNEVFPPLPPLPVQQNMSVPPPPYKRLRMNTDEPPPPGLEDDDE